MTTKDEKDEGGWTPVHYAARGGRDTCLSILIAAGADINVKDDDDKTPLDLAKRSNHHACADILQAQLIKQRLLADLDHLIDSSPSTVAKEADDDRLTF